MVDYNPSFPDVLGNEWVPIRSEPAALTFEQETGSSFSLPAATTVINGRFYLEQVPADDYGQVVLMSVYPALSEASTGAVRQIDIPVSGGALTGGATLDGGPTPQAVLASPADSSRIVMPAGASVDLSFAVTAAGPTLSGKRIIAVDLVHSTATTQAPGFSAPVSIKDTTGNPAVGYGDLEEFAPHAIPRLSAVQFGEINPFLLGHPSTTRLRFPWTFPQLQRFDNGAGNKLTVSVFSVRSDTLLRHAVLRVTFCEESRLAVGALASTGGGYTMGGNTVEMRSVATLAAGGIILQPAFYSVTVTRTQEGTATLTGAPPVVRQLRELTAVYVVDGVVVTRPTVLNKAGSRSHYSPLIPQLALGTATGTVSGVHPYGTQLPVPILGPQVARQDIAGAGAGTARYRYVRFYARRIGRVILPLELRSMTDAAAQVQITPDKFDQLPEIVDGWKEVTLPFPGAGPTAGNTVTTWEWSAPNTTGSSHWQVLAARAPSPTGTQALGPATYAGDTVRLSTGPASAPAPVPDADAVLMLLREPPPVVGLTVTQQVQPLPGAEQCGTPAAGTITAISYLQVVADASDRPASLLEVQRADSVDPQWRHVVRTLAPVPLLFADYEARVGVTSQYRARTVTLHGIVSAWSDPVEQELTAPGVAGPAGERSVLIFTSNTAQDGALNVAYPTAFERTVAEEFTFPEAGQVVFHRMYGRDFQVAFRGLERGGEVFTRTLLVHSAAMPAPSLANMTRLRDLAWADLPYVCVRDELGNRWLASVQVPSGVVRSRRRLYLARVDITEVTQTPHPVNPWPEEI